MKSIVIIRGSIIMLLLSVMPAFGQVNAPNYDQVYVNNPWGQGLRLFQRYYQKVPANDPAWLSLGDRMAGYDLGRYALHSLMWYHLAWERSSEYGNPSTTDAERLFFLTEGKNKIDTMSTEPYFRDISHCGDIAFKGRDQIGENRWLDERKGWGFRRPFDALVPVTPSYMGSNPPIAPTDLHIDPNTWYKVKIRAENIPATNNTRLSVWFTVAGQPFEVEPWYSQVYQGRGWKDINGVYSIVENLDAPGGDRIWYTRGTISLLSSFANVKYRDLVVYRGIGASRTEFYNLADRGPDYLNDIGTFYDEWIRVGHVDIDGSDLDVWGVADENGHYTISTTAAEGYTVLIPPARQDQWNHGVFAMAVLDYNDGIGEASDLTDCEVEYEVRLLKRTSPYADAGVAVRAYTKNDVPIEVDLAPPETVVPEYHSVLYDPVTMFASIPPTFPAPTVTHNIRYLGMSMRPDALRIAFHMERDQSGTGQFFQGVPWDNLNTVDPDSLAYTEGANYEGEGTGAILRFAHLVKARPTGSAVRDVFDSDADTFMDRMNENTVPKWSAASQLGTASGLFYGMTQSSTLLACGDMNDGLPAVAYLARVGGLFQYTKEMNSGADPADVAVAKQYFDDYKADIPTRYIPVDLDQGRSSSTWFESRRWWDTYSNGYGDRGHSCPQFRFLYLEHLLHTDADIEDALEKTADNFVEVMWTTRDIGTRVGISAAQCGGPASNKQVMDDYPLLACKDWMVWEICNDFYRFKASSESGWGNAAAIMVYAAKYGVPRNLRAQTIGLEPCGDESGSTILLRWDPPSDYPCGYHDDWNTDNGPGNHQWDWPGTGLKNYIVQRRRTVAEDFNTCAVIAIPDFQRENKYPWFIDENAEPGATYEYRVCTQDWTMEFTNLSAFTDPIQVIYPAAYSGSFGTTANGMLLISRFPIDNLLSGTEVVDRGVYYAPFNPYVANGATLVLNPGVQIIFGDSAEFQIHGHLEINGGPDCDMVVLTGESGVGSWWGTSIFPEASHDINHAIIEDAINNIIIFDDGGIVSNSIVRSALHMGVTIRNGIDTSPAQLVTDCDVYGNGWSNFYIYSGIPDGMGGFQPIYPTIQRTAIHDALTDDGLFVADRSYPMIQDCDIFGNARHGVHCWFVHGQAMSGENVTVYNSRISDHPQGSAIEIAHSNALVRWNEITGNAIGVHPVGASLLQGALSFGDGGLNQLDDNDVHLKAEYCDGIYFGVYDPLTAYGTGGHNTFTSPGTYHIQSIESSGFAQCDTYDPWDPWGTTVFSIPGYPLLPDIEVLPLQYSCADPNSPGFPKTGSYSEKAMILREIPKLVKVNGVMGLTEILQEYENEPAVRRAILTWLGTYAANGSDKLSCGSYLDSLATKWTGNKLDEVQRARIPSMIGAGRVEASMNAAVLERDSKLAEYVREKNPRPEWTGLGPHEVFRLQSLENDREKRSYSLIAPGIPVNDAVFRAENRMDASVPSNHAFFLYPNPASGIVNIGIRDQSQFTAIKITDILGREYLFTSLDQVGKGDGILQIDVSSLPRNRYIVMLIGEGRAEQTLLILK